MFPGDCTDPKPELYWRALILYGMNVATYKFALGRSLLELSATGRSRFSLDEVAIPFAKHMVAHVKSGKSQCTNQVSSYIDACGAHSRGEIDLDRLVEETKIVGFRYVLDAFHGLRSGQIAEPFYTIDGSGKKRNLILTDNMSGLQASPQIMNLDLEVEARWNLIEDTWTGNSGTDFSPILFDLDTRFLVVEERSTYRRSLAKARDALVGYQKGKCFYCFNDILVKDELNCEVDHFIPFHIRYKVPFDLNGVWNLVISCESCNRGANTGKFGALATVEYLRRLVTRNNYLVNSHHPLSNTLAMQIGGSNSERNNFLSQVYQGAEQIVRERWRPKFEYDFDF